MSGKHCDHRRNGGDIRIRIVPLFMISLFVSFAFLEGASGPAEAEKAGPDELWISLVIDDMDPRGGFLSLLLTTDPDVDLVDSELKRPDIGNVDNGNLDRVLPLLKDRFEDAQLLFTSFLLPEGEAAISDVRFRISNTTGVYAFFFGCRFETDEEKNTMEYRLLPILRSVPIPSGTDPASIARRNSVIRELSLAHISIELEFSEQLNLDLQRETSGHERTLTSERFREKMNLYEFKTSGDGIMLTTSTFFLPVTLFSVTSVLIAILLISLTIIWWRNRFRKWGLILPSATIISFTLPFVFFFRPDLNIYGTFDSLLIGSWIMDSLMVVFCFFINPTPREEKLTSYEEEKAPTFEMPKVLYMERPVYIRMKGESTGDLDPYRLLGVSRDMSMEEIEKHFRKEILKYHPDRFHTFPDQVRELSVREAERLNAAYEMICRERGLKD